ncbi:PIG-L deacetylase family protein [Spirosoma areae]
MISGVDQTHFFDRNVEPVGDDWLKQVGTTVVIAPHPDDESLGCGGAIALLRQTGQSVYVVFVSDGSRSHPHSRQYPPERLRQLREREALAALHILGVEPDAVQFMRLVDTKVPAPGQPDFADAVTNLHNRLMAIAPQTMLIPWRRDPHTDHRASWHLTQAAVEQMPTKPTVIEYPIWLWELGTAQDQPRPHEVRARSLAIDSVMELKQQAIAAHRSQVTHLIDDDPTAFYLSPDLLRYFRIPHEVFFIP